MGIFHGCFADKEAKRNDCNHAATVAETIVSMEGLKPCCNRRGAIATNVNETTMKLPATIAQPFRFAARNYCNRSLRSAAIVSLRPPLPYAPSALRLKARMLLRGAKIFWRSTP